MDTATEPDKEDERSLDENPEEPQIIHKINVPVTSVPVEIPVVQQKSIRSEEEKIEISVEEQDSDQKNSAQETNKEEQKTEM